MALHVAAVPGLTCDRLGEGRRGYYQNITIKILYPILTDAPGTVPGAVPLADRGGALPLLADGATS